MLRDARAERCYHCCVDKLLRRMPHKIYIRHISESAGRSSPWDLAFGCQCFLQLNPAWSQSDKHRSRSILRSNPCKDNVLTFCSNDRPRWLTLQTAQDGSHSIEIEANIFLSLLNHALYRRTHVSLAQQCAQACYWSQKSKQVTPGRLRFWVPRFTASIYQPCFADQVNIQISTSTLLQHPSTTLP